MLKMQFPWYIKYESLIETLWKERKEKEIYDLPLSIFKIRRGEKKIGFREMCSEHHLLVDL